jgi:hypothetical protein
VLDKLFLTEAAHSTHGTLTAPPIDLLAKLLSLLILSYPPPLCPASIIGLDARVKFFCEFGHISW